MIWGRGFSRVPVTAEKWTDEELMSRFQQGDQEGFEQLYRKHKSSVYSFLARQFTSPENANELTQEVFFKVVKSAQTYRHGSKFTTWLFSIARNLAIDSTRKAKHRKHTSLDQTRGDDRTLLEKLPAAEPTPDRRAAARSLQKDLTEAIDKMPDDQREVFLLREYHGISFPEIAVIVNAKEGTVKSRMRYALQFLKNELAPWSDYARTLP